MINFFIFSTLTGLILLFVLKKVTPANCISNFGNKLPDSGGIGLFFAFIVGYLLVLVNKKLFLSFDILWVLFFALLMFIIGLFDDLKEFSLVPKILMQVIFTLLFLAFSGGLQVAFLPTWLNYLISFIWILVIMNAFNLLDVGDGLCGGISLIISLFFFAINFLQGNFAVAGLFASLAGALSALLLFNFPPATIIMGNAGSHFLGFLFASISIYAAKEVVIDLDIFLTYLFILLLPIVDTFYVAIKRLKKKMIPLKKSKDHIFLRLIFSGYNSRRALLKIYLACFCWCLSGFFWWVNLQPLFYLFLCAALLFTYNLIYQADIARD
jgi:UDP-GlcNAc:undecaprenyl-phosphate GlcNAc-1-phosphate transferase